MIEKDLFYPLGDCAVVIKLGHEINMQTHHKVMKVTQVLAEESFPGMIEVVPAFTTVTIYYDPYIVFNHKHFFRKSTSDTLPYDKVCIFLKNILTNTDESFTDNNETLIDIPVCYDDEFAPDLPFVADHNGIQAEEVIRCHIGGSYTVFMLGFAPGFPYLGGLSERITAPRKNTPRRSVPIGSVGIAGAQTGIYSMESPGGWQIIGRTPISLFNSHSNPPSLLKMGDRVRFYRISRKDYDTWEERTS